MNVKNIFGMESINHWLHFSSWSISLHVLFTIDLLIFHKVLLGANLFPLDSFSLSVIPRLLNTFMLRSANWNMIIPLIWVKSSYADVSYLTISALQVSGSFPTLEGNAILKIPTVTVIYVTITHYCKRCCIQKEIAVKYCEKMHSLSIYIFACTPFKSSESINIEHEHIYASESPTKFAFAILLHVVCLFSFWVNKVNNLLIKNKKY